MLTSVVAAVDELREMLDAVVGVHFAPPASVVPHAEGDLLVLAKVVAGGTLVALLKGVAAQVALAALLDRVLCLVEGRCVPPGRAAVEALARGQADGGEDGNEGRRQLHVCERLVGVT